MIDQLPAVIAFAEARIQQMTPVIQGLPVSPEIDARIDELERVISLCRGFQAQSEIFEKLATA